MISLHDYIYLVESYLNLELKNLDPDYKPEDLYTLADMETRMTQEISFTCLLYTIRLIKRYKTAILWTDNFDLVNEAYRMIFRFMEILINDKTIQVANLYKLFTYELKNTKRTRKYFTINENTIKLLNVK